MSFTVRPAAPDDASVIADFQVRMAWESERISLERDIVRQAVGAVFDDPSKGRYWVAEADARVIGVLLTTPEWSDWRNGYVLWLQSVYVAPEWRRQGVFRALYQGVRDEVDRSPDLLGIRLYAEQHNEGAQSVYEAVGMTRDRYFMYEWMKGH